jgi:hypothetical protein
VIEQRRGQRFELRLPFEVVRAGADFENAGETKNVSSAGVLFTSAVPLSVGDPIEYVITLMKAPASPFEVRLRCLGTVLRGQMESEFAATLERYEFIRGR